MKINIIGKLPPPKGGVTIHNERLFKWLRKKKINVIFSSINRVDNKEGGIYHISNIRKWMLNHLLKGFDSDIIHYQGANYYGLIYLVILKLIFKNNFKLFFTIHGEGYLNRLYSKKILGAIIKICLNKLDCIFVGGEHLVNQLEIFKGNREKISCVDAFLPPLDEDRKGLPKYIKNLFENNDKVICANAYNVHLLSDGSDLYGLHIMSELAKKLNSYNINCKVIIMIAVLNDRDYINNLFYGLKNVEIVSDEEVNGWEVISSSSLLIRPTSTDANAISMKEALMYGVDVIASDVVPRYSGVKTFKYPNVEDLFEKVCYSLSYGFEKVEVRNNIDDYIYHYKRVYDE